MIRKFAAILLYSLACLIQFGHSVIPHSHSDDHDHGRGGHHHHHHDNKDDSDDKGIFHLFSHYGHSSETFLSNTENGKLNSVRNALAVKADHFRFAEAHSVLTIPPITTGFNEPYIYISPHLVSFQLRGPPII
jgi:hypothetical protein